MPSHTSPAASDDPPAPLAPLHVEPAESISQASSIRQSSDPVCVSSSPKPSLSLVRHCRILTLITYNISPQSHPHSSTYYHSQTVDLASDTSSPRASSLLFRRKPVSSTASPLALRHSQASSASGPYPIEIPKPEQRFSRPILVDSPTLYHSYPTPPKEPSSQGTHESGPEDYDAYDYYE